ncbi:MAG: acetate/propionate family kinase [Chitinophagaceae bacterium]
MISKHRNILTINGGSSSIKFALFDAEQQAEKLLTGVIERIGLPGSVLSYQELLKGQSATLPLGNKDAISFFMDWLETCIDMEEVAAIGHRVVHGMLHAVPQLVSPVLLKELHRISGYDPEHLPMEIEIIERFNKKYPGLKQIVCFDTSFHVNMPRVATQLSLPRHYETMGLRRYGFHGLSYAYLMEELAHVAGKETANGKIILAHLGNGASMVAVKDGKSIDTSMGFTPTGGLVMGSRTGDLDPGVAWFLMQFEKMNANQFNQLINHQSGLLGVSETSSDMLDLLKIQQTDKRAAEAIELFCYQAKKWIGSFAAVLHGLDTLVFTGGIGEHAPEIREEICKGLQFLGIEVDEKENIKNSDVISTAKSRVTVRVIKTNEELMIAKSIAGFLSK